jgi:hypothetical protein
VSKVFVSGTRINRRLDMLSTPGADGIDKRLNARASRLDRLGTKRRSRRRRGLGL